VVVILAIRAFALAGCLVAAVVVGVVLVVVVVVVGVVVVWAGTDTTVSAICAPQLDAAAGSEESPV
jgi:hypothetical protein